MIEKITNQNQIARHKLAEKINELVDAVNELQEQVKKTDQNLNFEQQEVKDIPDGDDAIEEAKKTNLNVDLYVEHKKWIGSLCKFWSDDRNDCVYGILASILPMVDLPYEVEDCQDWYEHCEPVKPDSDVIFKGE